MVRAQVPNFMPLPSIPPTIRLETQIMAPIQTMAMEYHFCRCSAGMEKLLLFCSILSHP